MRDDWVGALMGSESNHIHTHHFHHYASPQPRVFTDENGIRFEVDSGKAASDTPSIGQMKNAKWVAYAARALVIRFWDLAKVCLFKTLIYLN